MCFIFKFNVWTYYKLDVGKPDLVLKKLNISNCFCNEIV